MPTHCNFCKSKLNTKKYKGPQSMQKTLNFQKKIKMLSLLRALCTLVAFLPFGHSVLPKHIVFVLSDDLGWNAPSFMNPDLVTPSLDQLAKNGTILSSFYTYMFCSPSRASFLTGRYPYKTECASSVKCNADCPNYVAFIKRTGQPEITSYHSAKRMVLI